MIKYREGIIDKIEINCDLCGNKEFDRSPECIIKIPSQGWFKANLCFNCAESLIKKLKMRSVI